MAITAIGWKFGKISVQTNVDNIYHVLLEEPFKGTEKQITIGKSPEERLAGLRELAPLLGDPEAFQSLAEYLFPELKVMHFRRPPRLAEEDTIAVITQHIRLRQDLVECDGCGRRQNRSNKQCENCGAALIDYN